MMTDVGYTKREAALTITISGIAELVSKVLLAIFTLIVNVQAKYLFFVAMILMEFARIGKYFCILLNYNEMNKSFTISSFEDSI